MCKCYRASDSFSVTAELVVIFSCCNNSDFFAASRRNTTSMLTQVMIRPSQLKFVQNFIIESLLILI